MNMMRSSSEQTLMREGKDMMIVMSKSRIPFAPFTSRSTRTILKTRRTRSIIGGTGRMTSSSAGANRSKRDMMISVKSKRHQLSEKYVLGEVVRCEVVRCSLVWCGVVWGVVWCGVVWCGVVRFGVVCGVWCVLVWCGVVWCGRGVV